VELTIPTKSSAALTTNQAHAGCLPPEAEPPSRRADLPLGRPNALELSGPSARTGPRMGSAEAPC